MHAFSEYERYLFDARLCYIENGITFPSWLEHEWDTFQWVFQLSRAMHRPLMYHTISTQLLDRIKNIETIRYRKLKNISPQLKYTVEKIVSEFVSLNADLQNPKMWRNKNHFSEPGVLRWDQACNVVYECLHIKPDPEWRKKREEEIIDSTKIMKVKVEK